MSAGSRKRKHHDSATEQPAKVRVVEKPAKEEKSNPDEKSRGQSRQAKSERRSKKVTKGTALLSQTQNLTREPELLAHNATPQKEDDLANGQDFVSLSADPDVAPSPSASKPQAKTAPVEKSLRKTKKPKKQFPTETTLPTSTPTEKSKKDRFILFIGNLPYAATTTSITNHFIALQPFTVRHSTDKSTGRSKGFAFLEFENFDKMKTCLKLYHHSMFDPESQPTLKPEEDEGEGDAQTKSRKNVHTKPHPKASAVPPPKPSKNARRINVELTAGGGGKSQQRKDRIQDKNKKLSEERERRHVKEAEEKAKAEQKGGKVKKERIGTGANADEGNEKGEERGNIHPSRLARVPVRR